MSRAEFLVLVTLGLILAIGAGAGASYYLIDLVSEAAETPCEKPEAKGWEPPKLQLCPKDMELWDCIRDAKYRSDI